MMWVKARFDFVAEQAPEISFAVDELFQLVDDTKDGWLVVINQKGKEGIVPSEYVDFLSPEELDKIQSEKNAAKPAPAMSKMNIRATTIEAQFNAQMHDEDEEEAESNLPLAGGSTADVRPDASTSRFNSDSQLFLPEIDLTKEQPEPTAGDLLWEQAAYSPEGGEDRYASPSPEALAPVHQATYTDLAPPALQPPRKSSLKSDGSRPLTSQLDREEGLAFRKSQQASLNKVHEVPLSQSNEADERQQEIARMAERARLRALAADQRDVKHLPRSTSQPILREEGHAHHQSYAPSTSAESAAALAPRPMTKPAVIIATALYDFEPQRHDELLARKGDTLFLLAVSSTRDWYLAKHMSRTGEPGLVPSNYVKVMNVAALDPKNAASAAGALPLDSVLDLPTLKEWKAQRKKQSLIPLKPDTSADNLPQGGEDGEEDSHGHLLHSRSQPDFHQNGPDYGSKKKSMDGLLNSMKAFQIGKRPGYKSTPAPMSTLTSGGIPKVISARIPTYTEWKATNTFTFRVNVNREQGIAHVVQRTYEDFHDLHLALLTQYPVEAGKSNAEDGRRKRVIPYLPAPVDVVNSDVTNKRRGEIDEYLNRLFSYKVPDHIKESPLLQNFFTPRQSSLSAIQSDAPVAGIQFGAESAALHPIYSNKIAQSGMAQDPSHFLGDRGHSIVSSKAPSHTSSSQPPPRAQQPHPFAAGNAREGLQGGGNNLESMSGMSHSLSGSHLADAGSPQVRIKIPDPKTNEMIALRVPTALTSSEMLKAIKNKLEVGGGQGSASGVKSVAYIDDEGDRVLILTEEDWRDAKEMAMRNGGRLNLYAN